MELTVIDLSSYLAMSGQCNSQITALCDEVSRNLRDKGALLVKDPRCSVEDNDRIVNMIERYFSSADEFKLLHKRPELHYQVLCKMDINAFLSKLSFLLSSKYM